MPERSVAHVIVDPEIARRLDALEGRELMHVRELDGISYWRKGPQDRWHQLPHPSGQPKETS